MASNRTFLKLAAAQMASTVFALAIFSATTAYIVSSAPAGVTYFILSGLGLFSLFLSLVIACYGIVKNISLLGCEYWNVRMVRASFIIQNILLCLGVLIYLVSLFFAR